MICLDVNVISSLIHLSKDVFSKLVKVVISGEEFELSAKFFYQAFFC